MASPSDPNPYSSPADQSSASPMPALGANAEVSWRVLDVLRQTRPWVRLLSIVGFIGSALMIVGGAVGSVAILASGGGAGVGPVEAGILSVYVFMGVLYLIPCLFLHRYASRITDLLATPQSLNLEAALEAQKSFWKFVGILTAIILVVYLVAIVGALIVGAIGLAVAR